MKDINLITLIITNIISVLIGVLIGEPLKKLINGGYKKDKVQKNKDKIIDYLIANNNIFRTKDIKENVLNKLKMEEVYKLLKQLEDEGEVKNCRTNDEKEIKDISWIYIR
ncbi:hypothetical protein U472_03220 [Orenia metallireducens]|uniref:Uncharacterized protein n=1 Tax=Orenia metallireducens TaxID=1413210 RepID=A0A1C0AB56_9FIRM|nr:hypothetical protein [Orenia metallireducens]OCL27578.1 hypothetical protein U472_03220 [Orenia metallireducens]